MCIFLCSYRRLPVGTVVVESEHREAGGKMFCVSDEMKRKGYGKPLGNYNIVLPSWPETFVWLVSVVNKPKNLKIEELDSAGFFFFFFFSHSVLFLSH